MPFVFKQSLQVDISLISWGIALLALHFYMCCKPLTADMSLTVIANNFVSLQDQVLQNCFLLLADMIGFSWTRISGSLGGNCTVQWGYNGRLRFSQSFCFLDTKKHVEKIWVIGCRSNYHCWLYCAISTQTARDLCLILVINVFKNNFFLQNKKLFDYLTNYL